MNNLPPNIKSDVEHFEIFNTSKDPVVDLKLIMEMALEKTPMAFIRFSDGELAILKKDSYRLDKGMTSWRGKTYRNCYAELDVKSYDSELDLDIHVDLLAAAKSNNSLLIKGIPTKHNGSVLDHKLLLELNGSVRNITFSDLLINSNYREFRNKYAQKLYSRSNVIIANHRARVSTGKQFIAIEDNFFLNYSNCLTRCMEYLMTVPSGSLVLSSASALTKVLGHRIAMSRSDITFIDVGTSINDLLQLPKFTRPYHYQLASPFLNPIYFLRGVKYRFSSEYQIIW